MKKILVGLIIVPAILMLISNSASAYIIDGDVSDWGINLSSATSAGYLDTNLPSGGLDIDVVTEDNADASDDCMRIYPGWAWYNYFDAEAMYFDNDSNYAYIAVISGMPKDGVNPPGNSYGPDGDAHKFKPGDIGLDLNKDGKYEYGVNVRDGKLYNVKTSVNNGYIKAGWKKAVYTWSDPYYNPWIINNVIGEGMGIDDGVEFSYKQGPDTGVNNPHYVIETRIPLDLLGISAGWGDEMKTLNLHWGMECGNDYLNLNADVNPVPEPGTMALLGMGLIGLAGFRKKRVKSLGEK